MKQILTALLALLMLGACASNSKKLNCTGMEVVDRAVSRDDEVDGLALVCQRDRLAAGLKLDSVHRAVVGPGSGPCGCPRLPPGRDDLERTALAKDRNVGRCDVELGPGVAQGVIHRSRQGDPDRFRVRTQTFGSVGMAVSLAGAGRPV